MLPKLIVIRTVGIFIWLCVEAEAISTGAPSRQTSAPGDNHCLQCHVGTRLDNSPMLEIRAEHGGYYQPGVRQRITIELKQPIGRVFGVQVTTRMASNAQVERGGELHPLGESMWVACDNDRERPAGGCPADAAVEFLNHSLPASTPRFSFDWTPPQEAERGEVILYAALNEITGSGINGARAHFQSLRLRAASTVAPPQLLTGGVNQAGDFGGGATISSGTPMEIYGENLALSTRSWGQEDFLGGEAPRRLAGVEVRIGGKAAYVQFVSPRQVNVIVPDGVGMGANEVELRNPAGASNRLVVAVAGQSPGLLAPNALRLGGKQYVAALQGDGELVGLPNRVARAGEWLSIFGVGFGLTEPEVAAGAIAPTGARLAGVWRVRVGSLLAEVNFGGRAPGLVGLYQINLRVPTLPPGEYLVQVEVNGRQTQEGVLLEVGQ